MYTVTKFIACKGKVKALMALGQSHFYPQDHTTMLLTESTWVDAWTVKEASDIMSNAAYLDKRMQSLKNFVKYFYGTCASLISQHSDDGSMTKYWWDIPEHANERWITFKSRHSHDRLPRGGQGLHIHTRYERLLRLAC